MKMNRKKRSRKLTTGMIMVILTCWIIPYFALSGILIGTYSARNRSQIRDTITASYQNAGTIVAENISAAIEKSRQATYDGVIKKSYEAFLKDGDELRMYRQVSSYLNDTYKFSKTISNTILLFADSMTLEYYTYSNAAGATYASIDQFKENAAEAVRLAARDLDTRIRFICIDGHLYLVRNLVRSDYSPFATLVMEINTDRFFESMENILWQREAAALLDGEAIAMIGAGEEVAQESGSAAEADASQESGSTAETEERRDLYTEVCQEYLREREADGASFREGELYVDVVRGNAYAVLTMKSNGQLFSFVGSLDRSAMLSDSRTYVAVYVLVFVTLIPLLIATFYYFYGNINRPVRALMTGTDKIRRGDYSYRVEPFDRNEEMGHLVDNFNHMAGRLEESFNRIYVEEIAERDATLKALQAQINPHFLNNTLEIINWKARMAGNDEVSEMISALSVMMNATLNRNNEMFISLEEELSYVDAYLYIIRQRFGEKFSFEREVDETLLDFSIPRLIIQPLVENAVEHGVDGSGRRICRMRVFAEPEKEKNLVIRVENNGTLTQEDREKIGRLLGEKNPENLDRTSIGIRNVNLRLRMLYGEDSGLTIGDDGSGMTFSEIRIVRHR